MKVYAVLFTGFSVGIGDVFNSSLDAEKSLLDNGFCKLNGGYFNTATLQNALIVSINSTALFFSSDTGNFLCIGD